jgi:hypothetical protein
MEVTRPKFFVLLAFVFFLLATLTAGGVITSDLPWAIPAGLTSFTVSLLIES